jgi:hypothetical protein
MKLNKCQNIATLLVLTILTVLLAKNFDIVFAQTANCTNKSKLLTVDNHPVWKWNGLNVVFYKSGMTIDADGAPNAYHPDNISLTPVRVKQRGVKPIPSSRRVFSAGDSKQSNHRED